MSFERIGASGESLRVRNSDWFVYRSYNGRRDIKVLRVNSLDQIEFMEIPTVGDQSLLVRSDISSLESRIQALESALGMVGASRFDIYATKITSEILATKQLVLPQAPISGKIVMLIRDTLPQFGGVDFEISGSTVSWNGYELTELIELDDDVRLIYLYHT